MDGSASTSNGVLVRVPAGPVILEGNLSVPESASGVVLFAHGSGSSRHSPRNRYVARELNSASLATLLIDLLTSEEEAVDAYTAKLRFDIGMLAERLVAATDWLRIRPETRNLDIGYFGPSTAAADPPAAAARRPQQVTATAARGDRPAPAGPHRPQTGEPPRPHPADARLWG